MTAVGRSMSSRTYVLKCKAEINSKTENFCSVKQEAYLSKILGYGASKFKPIFHAENFQANLKRKKFNWLHYNAEEYSKYPQKLILTYTGELNYCKKRNPFYRKHQSSKSHYVD